MYTEEDPYVDLQSRVYTGRRTLSFTRFSEQTKAYRHTCKNTDESTRPCSSSHFSWAVPWLGWERFSKRRYIRKSSEWM